MTEGLKINEKRYLLYQPVFFLKRLIIVSVIAFLKGNLSFIKGLGYEWSQLIIVIITAFGSALYAVTVRPFRLGKQT